MASSSEASAPEMQIDFYQLSRDPVERVVTVLAAKVVDTGDRVLVVSADAGQRAALSRAMWERENAFQAHGEAGEPHEARQPVLLSDACVAANGAGTILIADGAWRAQAAVFARAILVFDAAQTDEVRRLWGTFGKDGHALRIFKQREDGGWREGR